MYQQIVVALDGSAAAEMILPHVTALATSFRSTVTLVWATESPEMILAETLPAAMSDAEPVLPVDPTPLVTQEHRDAASYLAGVARRLTEHGIAVGYEDSEGPPAEVILATAERLKADLIAMTTHGRGGLERAILGSIADEVVRKTSCPMLLVRLDHDGAAQAVATSEADQGKATAAPSGT